MARFEHGVGTDKPVEGPPGPASQVPGPPGPPGADGTPAPPIYVIPQPYIHKAATTLGSDSTVPDPVVGPWPTTTRIRVSFDAVNTDFLNLNPKIWLFIWTRKRKKIAANDMFPDGAKVRNNGWSHPPHQLGVNFPNGAFYSGVTNVGSEADGNFLAWPLDTEFDVDPLFADQRRTFVELDLTQWFPPWGESPGWDAIQSAIDDWTIGDAAIPKLLAKGKRGEGIRVRFAIVCDRPNYGGATFHLSPKMRGPLSDEFIIKARPIYHRQASGDGFEKIRRGYRLLLQKPN